MAETYQTFAGMDWPKELNPIQIRLDVAKKWRLYNAAGADIRDPEMHMIDAATSLLPRELFTVSLWTEQHVSDFCRESCVITFGCASSSKSHDYGILLLLDWITDPYDTTTFVASTSKDALRFRTWDSILRCHNHLRQHAPFLVPGRHSKTGYAIILDEDSDAGIASEKTAIRGVAINEDGTVQGAHSKFVRLMVDELSAIKRPDVVEIGRVNMSVAVDFRFFGLCNPESWSDPGGKYAMPIGGLSTISVNSDSWRSRYGLVRHHDGFKSPCVVNPELAKKYPYLLTKAQVDARIAEAGGPDSPVIWKMLRGFIAPQGASLNVVITQSECDRGKATEALPSTDTGLVTINEDCPVVAGIDPAWSESGDEAILFPVRLMYEYGLPILFYDAPIRLAISASDSNPISMQLLFQVRDWVRKNNVPPSRLAVDSSGNQGLADLLDYHIAPGCMHVNSSVRASKDGLLKANDPNPPADLLFDTGTECWVTLAEFIRMGQVRGLPPDVVKQLTSRRFAVRGNTGALFNPPRLEPKEGYCAREGFKSPNLTDAAALAAQVVRVGLGIIPGSKTFPRVSAHRIFNQPTRIPMIGRIRTGTGPMSGIVGKYAPVRLTQQPKS